MEPQGLCWPKCQKDKHLSVSLEQFSQNLDRMFPINKIARGESTIKSRLHRSTWFCSFVWFARMRLADLYGDGPGSEDGESRFLDSVGASHVHFSCFMILSACHLRSRSRSRGDRSSSSSRPGLFPAYSGLNWFS